MCTVLVVCPYPELVQTKGNKHARVSAKALMVGPQTLILYDHHKDHYTSLYGKVPHNDDGYKEPSHWRTGLLRSPTLAFIHFSAKR